MNMDHEAYANKIASLAYTIVSEVSKLGEDPTITQAALKSAADIYTNMIAAEVGIATIKRIMEP